MAIIGTAYVTIRATTVQLQNDIARSFDAAAKGVGARVGQQVSRDIANTINTSKVTLGDGAIDAKNAGNVAANQALAAMRNKMRSQTLGFPSFAGNGNSAQAAARVAQNLNRNLQRANLQIPQIGTTAFQRVQSIAAAAGKKTGVAFLDNFGGDNISFIMKRVFYQILFGTPVVAAAGAAISALAVSFFSLTAAVGPAVNALAILPGLMGGIAAGFIGAAVAFGGVSKAFSAGNAATKKAAAGFGPATKAVVDNSYRIYQAQRAVEDAFEAAAESAKNAQQAIISAERGVAEALNRSREAQLNTTRAREDARRAILELQDSIEGGAISEGKALIELERARDRLAEMAELPVDHRLRREAELDVRQAALNLKQAQELNTDLAAENAQAQRDGVDGAEAVVEARNAELDAAQDVVEANEKLRDAQEDQTRAARDAAQRITDAQMGLQDALKKTADAAGSAGAAGGIDQFALAMSTLSPEAQRFVNYLLSIQDEFRAVRAAAGEELFPKLETAIQRIIDSGFLTVLGDGLRITAGAVGDVAIEFANLLASPGFQANFTAVMENSVPIITTLGDALISIFDALTSVAVAAAPVTQLFADWIAEIAGGWAEDAAGNMGGIATAAVEGARVLSELGAIFGDVWEGIKEVGAIAAPAGQVLIDAFAGAAENFANFTDNINKADLADFFMDAAESVIAIGGLVSDLAGIFISMADDPQILEIVQILRDEAVPLIEEILSAGIEMGPLMTEVFVDLLEIFKDLAVNGGLEAFLNALHDITGWFVGFLNTPGVSGFIGWIAVAIGTFKAFNLVSNLLHLRGAGALLVILGKALFFVVGGLVRATTAIVVWAAKGLVSLARMTAAWWANNTAQRAAFATTIANAAKSAAVWVASTARTAGALVMQTGAFIASRAAMIAGAAATSIVTAAQWALNAAMSANPIGLIIIAIVALIAGIVLLYNKNEAFRNLVQAAWAGIQTAIQAVASWFTDTLVPWLQGAWDAIVGAVRWAMNTYINIVTTVFNAVWGFIQFVWNGVVSFFTTVWEGIVWAVRTYINIVHTVVTTVFNAVKTFISNTWNGIRTAAEFVWNAIKDFIAGRIQAIKDTIELVGTIVERIKAIFQSVKDAIVEKFVAVLTYIAGIPQSILDKFTGFKTLLFSAGTDLIQGLMDGAEDMADKAVEIVTGIGEKIVDGVKEFFGIRSPSRVMAGLGGYIIEGLIVGIGNTAGQLPQLLDNVFGGVTRGASGAFEWLKSQGGGLLDSIMGGGGNSILDRIFGGGALEGLGKTVGSVIGGSASSLVAFGRQLQSMGFSVAEHPAFGGVRGRHMNGSKHYSGRAIDVNKGAGTSIAEQRAIDTIIELARQFGLRAIWRKPGHFNHAHFEYDRGGYLMPGATGVNNLRVPERVLSGSNTKSFDRLVEMLERNGGRLDSGGKTEINIHLTAPATMDIPSLAKQIMREVEFAGT